MPPTFPHRPTIRDLARVSGLSKSTISAALLDNHSAAAETRKRVHLLAGRMGYVRNAFASTLATRGKTRPVGTVYVALVSHFPHGVGAADYHFRPIEKRLHELGYEGHHYDLFRDRLSGRALRNLLYKRGYRGIIFDNIRESQSEVFAMDWKPFCLVSSGRTYYEPRCDVIRGNSFKSIYLAWTEIRRSGRYRRIGFALCRHSPMMLDDIEREGALAICHAKMLPREHAIPPYLGPLNDRSRFGKWFRRNHPDVVVGFNLIHYDWLQEMGLRIPQDVAFASLNEVADGTTLAGINEGESEGRIRAVEHLDFLIRHRRAGFPAVPWEILAPTRWIPGASLPT